MSTAYLPLPGRLTSEFAHTPPPEEVVYSVLPEALVGEFDPNGELYDICMDFAGQQKKELGLRELPHKYENDLYVSGVRFVAVVIGGLRVLAQHSPRNLAVLFDLDRTTIAMSEDDETFDTVYTTRPGMGYLGRMIKAEIDPLPSIGALSDRTNEERLKRAVIDDHFVEPDIAELVDPALIMSSTDGEIARSLPLLLAVDRRPNLPQLAKLQLEHGRLNAIGSIATAAHEGICDPTVEYHNKAGVLAELVRRMPHTAFLWPDDINTTRLVNSERALGVYVDPSMQPLLPNDLRYTAKK
jgi:hypothetical protein